MIYLKIMEFRFPGKFEFSSQGIDDDILNYEIPKLTLQPIVENAVLHGIVDYISDGVDGYLCNPFDADAFAVAIKKLLDPNTRKLMSLDCQKAAEPFDIANSRKAMQEIYKELLV